MFITQHRYKGKELGRVVTEKGTFLKDTTLFDHLEFGITNRDARAMALSTRKLIELAFLALLDSGIDYRSQNVGCFTSGIIHDTVTLGNIVRHSSLPVLLIFLLNRLDPGRVRVARLVRRSTRADSEPNIISPRPHWPVLPH